MRAHHEVAVYDVERVQVPERERDLAADTSRITRCDQNRGVRAWNHDLSIAHVDHSATTQSDQMSFAQITKQTVVLNPANFLAAW